MLASLEKAYKQTSESSSFFPHRKKAWDAFKKIGLPTKKHDAFRYFPVRLLEKLELQSKPSAWQEGDIISLPMEEAMVTYRAVIEKALIEAIARETNPLALAQLATGAHFQFLYVPPGKKAHITTDLYASAFLFIGRGAEVTWESRSKEGATLSGWHVFQEAGSRLQASIDLSQLDGCHLHAHRFSLKRDAHLQLFTYSQGGVGMRQDLQVHLLEENSSADLRGLSVLRDKREHHNYVCVRHAAPSCRSDQHFKSVVFDRAKSSFEGKIFVESAAQQTEAYQLCNHLVVGASAIANSKPNLEIFADDVKASHGATVSQIGEELDYLRSRGIPADQAKELLIRGFCSAFFDQMPESLQTYDI